MPTAQKDDAMTASRTTATKAACPCPTGAGLLLSQTILHPCSPAAHQTNKETRATNNTVQCYAMVSIVFMQHPKQATKATQNKTSTLQPPTAAHTRGLRNSLCFLLGTHGMSPQAAQTAHPCCPSSTPSNSPTCLLLSDRLAQQHYVMLQEPSALPPTAPSPHKARPAGTHLQPCHAVCVVLQVQPVATTAFVGHLD